MSDRIPAALRRSGAVALVAMAAALLGAVAAAPATAHIQVRPTMAAPLDPTLWTVLVPNERSESTTEVELQVPEDVFPFSYADQPGWKRTLRLNDDGTVNTILWEGRLASDGLAEFEFLATTPEQEGEIAWKALQTYEDGKVVRWIGAPDSEEPASYTTVSADVPPQNAGGEGAEESGSAAGGKDDEGEGPGASADSGEGDGGDALPIVLAAIAVVLSGAALLVALRRGRSA